MRIPYSGIAISRRPNPLILPLAAEVLKNGLAAVEKGKAIGASPERERDWLSHRALLQGRLQGRSDSRRGLAYEKAMDADEKYPDDPEAAIFYALALNETALPSDKTYVNQIKAGAILETGPRLQPDHPGALHYLIHSYDYTPLAQRALSAANKYAGIAPAAQHAQHMPAHTYSMLGLWAQSVESNTKSRASAREPLPGFGQGRQTQANRTTSILWSTPSCKWGRSNARNRSATTTTPSRSSGTKLWLMHWFSPRFRAPKLGKKPRRSNREAASFRKLGPSLISPAPWAPRAAAIWPPRIGSWISSKNSALALEKANQSYWAEQVEIQMFAASAWIAHAKGQKDEAAKFMRAAADLEDNSAKHIAMENRLYPMRELLGDLLLEQQQPSQAFTEYETSFQSAPNRLRGLYGAAKAGRRSGTAGEGDRLLP